MRLNGVQADQSRHGFSLVELMVVMILIAILAAAIVPEMRGTYEQALLRATSRKLIDTFQLASSRAVALNQLHRVRLEGRNGHYQIETRPRDSGAARSFQVVDDFSGASGTLDARITLDLRPNESPSGAEPEAEPASRSQTATPASSGFISFYPDGTADAVQLFLKDRQGFQIVLRINPITACVELLDAQGE